MLTLKNGCNLETRVNDNKQRRRMRIVPWHPSSHMVRSEPTPIPVGKQQLATCGRGPTLQHRGHLCESCDLNASVSLPQCNCSKQKEVFLSADQSSPKEHWKFHPRITWNWSFLGLLAQLCLGKCKSSEEVKVMGYFKWISPIQGRNRDVCLIDLSCAKSGSHMLLKEEI